MVSPLSVGVVVSDLPIISPQGRDKNKYKEYEKQEDDNNGDNNSGDNGDDGQKRCMYE